MFKSYKKKYFKILEIIKREKEINYKCYEDIRNDDLYKTIKDPHIRDMVIEDNLKSMDYFLNRFEVLSNLIEQIQSELKD